VFFTFGAHADTNGGSYGILISIGCMIFIFSLKNSFIFIFPLWIFDFYLKG